MEGKEENDIEDYGGEEVDDDDEVINEICEEIYGETVANFRATFQREPTILELVWIRRNAERLADEVTEDEDDNDDEDEEEKEEQNLPFFDDGGVEIYLLGMSCAVEGRLQREPSGDLLVLMRQFAERLAEHEKVEKDMSLQLKQAISNELRSHIDFVFNETFQEIYGEMVVNFQATFQREPTILELVLFRQNAERLAEDAAINEMTFEDEEGRRSHDSEELGEENTSPLIIDDILNRMRHAVEGRLQREPSGDLLVLMRQFAERLAEIENEREDLSLHLQQAVSDELRRQSIDGGHEQATELDAVASPSPLQEVQKDESRATSEKGETKEKM